MPMSKGEKGSYAIMFAASISIIMLVFSLAVDVGGAAIRRHRAQIAADAAAFAAAQSVDLDRLFTDNQIVLNTSEAAANAGRYASINGGESIAVTAVYVQDNYVCVTAASTYRTYFLAGIGRSSLPIRVRSCAKPLQGIEYEGQGQSLH